MGKLNLICPVCREPLLRRDASWRCSGGHAFDVAREGYVNLLPVQNRNSKSPGDNPDMVRARRDFLAAGHYAPLRDRLAAMVSAIQPARLLDIGCGEGYYTQAFASPATAVIGLDIAKPAIRLASRLLPEAQWIVGSGALIPLADGGADLVTSLFSPLPVAEMHRVLTPDGLVLMVTPSDRHLWNIREALFGEVRAHEPEKFLAILLPGFTLAAREELAFPLTLDKAALRQLLMMTPYVWKARPERRQALEACEHWTTEARFTIMTFARNARLTSPD